MAQTLLNHETMITNIIGDWTPTSHPELFKAGFNYVADLIPAESELWSSGNIRSLTSDSATLNVGQTVYKIIKVIRTDNSIDTVCTEVPYKELQKGKNSNSIFYNANNINSPIWTWTPEGKIEVSPSTSVGTNPSIKIYYWVYEFSDYFGDPDGAETSFDSYHITEDLFGFPKEAQLLGVIRAAQNILQTKIGTAIHDDEDAELVTLLQGQMTILDKWFQEEMQRLRLPYKQVGVEDK